jgi:signal transduction histidine kinase
MQNKSTKIDITTAKRYRLILRILFCLVDFVLPIVIIGLKYKFFTQFTGIKLTLMGAIVALLVLFRFRAKLLAWVNTWEYSVMKYIILGINKIFIFLLVWFVAMLAEAHIGNLAFCLGWIALCSAIAYLVINPFIEKYDYIVKKEIRKAETKEALRELQEEDKK